MNRGRCGTFITFAHSPMAMHLTAPAFSATLVHRGSCHDRSTRGTQRLAAHIFADPPDAEASTQFEADSPIEHQWQGAEDRREGRHQDRSKPQQARFRHRVVGEKAPRTLRVEGEIDDDDRVLLYDADLQDEPDARDETEIAACRRQREQRTEASRGKGGQDRDRMDEAFVKDAERNTDRDDSCENQ